MLNDYPKFLFLGEGGSKKKRNSIDDVTAFYVRRQKSSNVLFVKRQKSDNVFFPSDVRRSIDDVFYVRRRTAFRVR